MAPLTKSPIKMFTRWKFTIKEKQNDKRKTGHYGIPPPPPTAFVKYWKNILEVQVEAYTFEKSIKYGKTMSNMTYTDKLDYNMKIKNTCSSSG